MTLEDFEKELAESQAAKSDKKRERSRSPGRPKHRHHHRSSRHADHHGTTESESRHRHKRSRHDDDHKRRKGERRSRDHRRSLSYSEEEELEIMNRSEPSIAPPTEETTDNRDNSVTSEQQPGTKRQRDSWMEAPSSLDIDYVQRKQRPQTPTTHVRAVGEDYKIKLHRNELNHQLQEVEQQDDRQPPTVSDIPSQHSVNYSFGDAGSSWRMSKLNNVYRQAKESGRSVDDVAQERYGDLRDFDDAREEEIELDRRKTYGNGYVGNEKPSGVLFQERKMEAVIRIDVNEADEESEDEFEAVQGERFEEKSPPATTVALDQTALNKLKASMMRAKLKKAPDAAKLEAEYDAAIARAANQKQPGVVVLSKSENRMLAGGREGEVKRIDNKRGRERGMVEENEDMSIEDMVRQERRTKTQLGGEGKAFAERIAKDAKFDNDLDYMDDNASKLAKSVQKSDVNLRNTAISDYHKMKRILDNCPLCYHEDTSTPPQAPVVSLATRVYLTLPTSPEITPYGLCCSIVPVQHRRNLLECDDDEWEEIRNFMKSLSRFYYAQKPQRTVIFYENAAQGGSKRHASMEAIPLPLHLGETVSQFFKEAILAADEEWTQHRKIIDTLAKAKSGLGKLAFRRSMVSELPYFHAWFSIDGGLGHVVEDSNRWPKGDLFAREIIGGMLDVSAEIIKRQGRWKKGDADMEDRLRKFKKNWDKFDWTVALMEPQ